MTLPDAETLVLNLSPGRVLTDADAEALRVMLDHRDELRRLADSLADRVHRQSDLLSKRAERTAGTKLTGSGT